ncbi:CRISPR-associated endonuclease Cas3'' [Nocardiopsis sp. CNR-923]|uniref:CRISPR-associated endonuclease Cas3'' n=1 Tax=Nocardiopsis sp. CNR-923 TaxID=1904965 RepID=UPI00096AA244|nr:CRISPR-associated endonuclease Cas3'' [Nocardiopsis sp. CNR-923]
MAYPLGSSAGTEHLVDLCLWAKERDLGGYRHPLVCHAMDAAAMALALWEEYLAPGPRATISSALGVDTEQAGRLIAYWAGLHDIGKATPQFQHQIPIDLPAYPTHRDIAERVGHATATARWLETALPQVGYPPTDEPGASTLLVAQLLGGHHGLFPEFFDSQGNNPLRDAGFDEDRWNDQRWQILHTLTELLGRPQAPETLPEPIAGVVCGLVILADWLVSQKRHVLAQKPHKPKVGDKVSLRSYFERQRSVTPKLLVDSGLRPLTTTPATFPESFPEITTPNGLQTSVAEHLPQVCTGAGLLLITAPTGMGKTEAAFHAADIMGYAAGCPGRYIALPTMATADQMYGRLRGYAEHRADVPRPLTLLHSMAWLNEDYHPGVLEAAPSTVLTSGPDGQGFKVTDWLFGRKRGLLASWSVGTIDQVLMAVLRLKHNVVRLLGLIGKVVVVDEAHAVDPYMQEGLERLLRWLGKLNVPVILLSATLHRTVADAYVTAYLEGAGQRRRTRLGRRRRKPAAPAPAVDCIDYPGWIHADIGTGTITRNPEPIIGEKRDPLQLDLVPIPQEGSGRERRVDRAGALKDELAGLLSSGKGCAAVICTTVAEAQETYDLLDGVLCERFPDPAERPELLLLHARFPGWQRDEITEKVVRFFGKKDADKNRPKSAILVATQIIEQSLDLDFDSIITDLAPISLLLQRAGRCWRHQRLGVITRPAWAQRPRVAVLAPEQPTKSKMPEVWTFVYAASLLVRTQNLLREREGRPVEVPGDVQKLVERVYDDPGLIDDMKHDIDRLGKDMGMRTLAKDMFVSPDGLSGGLYELTAGSFGVDEEVASTRFDADSVRVLCCFKDARGETWLDRERTVRLPERGAGPEGVFTEADLAQVIRRTIPVRGGQWVPPQKAREGTLPQAWRRDFRLRELIMIPQYVKADGAVEEGEVGDRSWTLHKEKGLMWR